MSGPPTRRSIEVGSRPVRRRAPRRSTATVSCGACDVTWWGMETDACWACGRSDTTMIAPPMAVRRTLEAQLVEDVAQHTRMGGAAGDRTPRRSPAA